MSFFFQNWRRAEAMWLRVPEQFHRHLRFDFDAIHKFFASFHATDATIAYPETKSGNSYAIRLLSPPQSYQRSQHACMCVRAGWNSAFLCRFRRNFRGLSEKNQRRPTKGKENFVRVLFLNLPAKTSLGPKSPQNHPGLFDVQLERGIDKRWPPDLQG